MHMLVVGEGAVECLAYYDHLVFQTVMVIVNPSETEASVCSEQASLVGVIGFFFGDEVSRTKYRR